MDEINEDVLQQIQDLQDQVQAFQDEVDDHENRLTDLESPYSIGIDSNLQFDIEDTLFNVLNVLKLFAGFPIFTVARDLVNNPPKQGELWIENITGQNPQICDFISGTKYCVPVGLGVVSSDRATAQTAAKSLKVYTVGANDSSFMVSANVRVTTSTTHNFTVTVSYTDETNTAQTLTMQFSTVTGVLLTAIINTGGANPYEGVPLHIRCKAGTTITIASTGTFTTVTYNIEGVISQIA